jgi:hypothetical protein
MIMVLYRPNSEHERAVLEWQKELSSSGIEIKLVDVDSQDGVAKVELYDATEYPSVLAIKNDGSVLQMWKGKLPLLAEVGYYNNA